jgi:predicted transcriptional regulator
MVAPTGAYGTIRIDTTGVTLEMAMLKTQLPLSEPMINALKHIETATDLPRTRIIRRAINEYIKRYAAANPDFAAKVEGTLESERVFKDGIVTDTLVAGGRKIEVVVTPNGWRMPTPDDYIEEKADLLSVLDREA